MVDQMLTTEDVAKVLEVTRVRVWQMIVRDKKLRAHKLGRIWVIRPADLRDYVEKRGRDV